MYALVLDGFGTDVNRDELIEALDEAIAAEWNPRETWGTGSRARQGQRAMMSLAPGVDMADVERIYRERAERDRHR